MKIKIAYLFLTLLFLILPKNLVAQDYNKKITELKLKVNEKKKKEIIEITSYLKNHKINKKQYNADGTFKELIGFHFDGTPRYYTLSNINAANTTRTNYLNPGGSLNLNLQGQDMRIGIWDGGTILTDHNEFTDGLFSYRSSIGESSSSQNSNSAHATHVAGTMVAYGVVPEAKGMAPRANIVSYNWTNDASEVINEIQENNLLISNHSYGTPIFNENGVQQLPAYLPGKYDDEAKQWDEIANAFPYYLMVVAAGNEGNLSYEGSIIPNRDKLVGNTNSKNNLVVANAQNAQINPSNGELVTVAIASSSSQGPTDDLRIKPDIAGMGTNVYSSIDSSPSSYATLTGTSMASPNVAGTLLLLQEYYNNLNENYMKAATLKGLVCHTADDAGKIGPDIVFGWGLLNAKKAAETIEKNSEFSLIEERTLTPFDSYTFNVQAIGNEPLKISISWNDPAGNISNNTNANDPIPALINDLDIKVVQNEVTYFPYKLNPNNINGNAIKGNNNVDNLEIVNIENPSGIYTVTISHKGLLEDPQDYSIIATGIDFDLNTDNFNYSKFVIYPNPVKDILNIQFLENLNSTSKLGLKIYDITGRLIYTDNSSIKNLKSNINLKFLEKGTYFLNAKLNNKFITKKFIKE
ncbi:S8 family serine peptidase [Mesonia aestuariivivens]|uniref:S8 family serine peptidase n=1 Tax=Mesonia aestuariivivens TaxID=2796128 RepID=A0ABS6W2Y6_9FLAO|nr:S8 family serine peptidase [Mesonia aestuariivivens]MBW2962227.1 S8 family serine peptidase [Mesonia aestuariivivens]